MSFENTTAEQEMDTSAQQRVQGIRSSEAEIEPDLAVDGLSDSILSRLLSLFGIGRS